MLIEYRDGLLLTEISFHFNGRMKVIKNIVIDTGTSHILISQDEVDDIGIKVTLEDDIITSYGIGGKEHASVKVVQKVELGDYALKDIQLDFASFKYHNINRLLGLDILMNGKFNIDLDKLELLRM
jgi:predicted aspartyl protease